MQKIFALIIFFSSVLLASVSLSGCRNSSDASKDSESLTLEISNSSRTALVSTIQTWHVTEKKVCVLFGYGFNDQDTVSQLVDLLSDHFGLSEDGGLILPLVYPDDFKHGTRGYVNDFVSVLQDDSNDFCGVVILGAPANTHVALARNQDKWNQNVPYPVISLFPQDEVLGIEANSDIVLDKGKSTDEDKVLEEESETVIQEAPDVLLRTINYMMTLDGPLSTDKTIQTHVSQMLKGYNTRHYVDPETGLQSINHFILK